jgi:predicted transcriptional regulator
MKTAVSIPDDVFEDAERLASRLHTSRSQFSARALADFVARGSGGIRDGRRPLGITPARPRDGVER